MRQIQIQVQQDRHLTNYFKALANQTRLNILRVINSSKNMTGTEIITALDIRQSIGSYHLSILVRADILISERYARSVMYRINPNFIESYDMLLKSFLGDS